MKFVAILIGLLTLPNAALAFDEAAMVAKFCVGMNQQRPLPDRTRMDCLSQSHAIEVDKSSKWAEAIGQALHYSLWTAELPSVGEKRAGIVLVCETQADRRETCIDHAARLYRVIEHFDLPVTVWDCDDTDASLGDCQQLEFTQ